MLTAQAHDLPVHQDHFHTQHVVGGKAVFQAMHAARVFSHVAADGAGDFRRRIGRVVKAFIGNGVGDAHVGDARLHHGASVVVIDVDNFLKLAKPQRHRVGQGKCATR